MKQNGILPLATPFRKLLLIILVSGIWYFPPEEGWGREEEIHRGFVEEGTGHFTIRFDGYEDRDVYRDVLDILEEAYRDVGKALSYYPDQEITVYLYTKEQFSDITRSPSRSGAIYDGSIRLPIRNYKRNLEALKRILYHEYSHAVIHRISGGRAPTWLNEGLAQYLEGGDNRDKVMAARAIVKKAGTFLPLDKLDGSFMGLSDKQASLAYAESYLAVRYLVEKYGIYSIKRLLEELSAHGDTAKVLKDTLYLSYDDLQKGLIEEVK